MCVRAITLKIETPTGLVLPGRGFYQLEEDALYVQVGEFSRRRRFFSYLESDRVRFDIDKAGRLMLIEVDHARRRWKVDRNLAPPTIGEPADIRWLDFRARIPDPQILTDEQRAVLLLRFAESSSWRWYALAESVLVQVDECDHLAAVWIADIVDDLAGQRIASFRKKVSRRLSPEQPASSLPASVNG